MKKILFKATQEEVLLISSESIDNLFDSISTDAKCCVLADKKVLDMHDSLRKQIENKNFIIYEISNPEEEKASTHTLRLLIFLAPNLLKETIAL